MAMAMLLEEVAKEIIFIDRAYSKDDTEMIILITMKAVLMSLMKMAMSTMMMIMMILMILMIMMMIRVMGECDTGI